MGKKADDSVMDAALAVVATCTRLDVNTAEPADRAAAVADSLATVVMTAGNGNGDYTIANGDTSGRKVTVAAQNGLTATAGGTASHISLSDASTLLYVTTLSSNTSISINNTVNVGAWDVEILDPA